MTGPELKPNGWMIHKAGRGWYRPDAHGYTSDPLQAGRFSHSDAMERSHPNGSTGPRDGITIKHESEVPGAVASPPVDYAALPEVQALIAGVLELAASMIEDNVRHAKDLGHEIWPIPDLRTLTPADAIAARDAMIAEAVTKERGGPVVVEKSVVKQVLDRIVKIVRASYD